MDEFTHNVIELLRESLEAYEDLADTLPEFLATEVDEKADAEVIRTYRAVSMDLARSIMLGNRIIDDMRISGYLQGEGPIVVQPLLRMIGESFFLLAMSKTREEILRAPLADPDVISRMGQNSAVQELLVTSAAMARDEITEL